MKKSIAFFAAILILGMAGMAQAAYVETLDIYDYSVGGTIDWTHTYDFSETPPVDATLCIVADDVDGPGDGLDGEQDAVYINGTFLGYLEDMGYYTDWGYQPGPGNDLQPLTTTIFDIDASLLDWTMPISVTVETLWGVEIETSTLTVSSQAIPDPASVLLLGSACMIGFGGVRRKFKR